MNKPKTPKQRRDKLVADNVKLNRKPQKYWVTDEEKIYLHECLSKFRLKKE